MKGGVSQNLKNDVHENKEHNYHMSEGFHKCSKLVGKTLKSYCIPTKKKIASNKI